MTKPTAIPDSAVAVIVPTSAAVFNLDEWPSEKFNRLIPTQMIRMPSDLMAPVIQVVALDPADRAGKSADHYKSTDVPPGHRALTARGLNKVSTAAGVSFRDEHRVDDGSDPDVIGFTVIARMMLPTGQFIDAPGTKWVNLNHQSWASDAQRNKYRSFFAEHVATRARNRAIRALLSLKSSYPEVEIARPFAVVSYAPNMAHPEVRERMLDAIAPRPLAALYGPEAKALGPGEPVKVLAEIEPDDDDSVALEDLGDLGVKVEADLGTDEPDWFATGTTAEPAKPLAVVLRDSAEASGLVGSQTQPQKEKLQAILGPLGRESVARGFLAAFDVELGEITAAQAQAVVAAASGDDAFAERWAAMVQAAV